MDLEEDNSLNGVYDLTVARLSDKGNKPIYL